MRLSLAATTVPDLSLPEVLDLASTTGFEFIQLYRDRTQSSPVHPDLSVRGAREHLERGGVAPSGLWIRNLTGRKADSNERNLAYNLRQISWDIHLARALGARAVTMAGGERNEEAREDLIAGVNELLENIPDVELNIASQPGTLLQDLTDFENVMPGVGSGARILLDTRALLSVGEDVIAFADAFAARIGLVQLGDQSAGKPVSLGRGELPLSPLIERLKKADYNGHIVIDEPPPVKEKDTAAARDAKELVQTML